MIKSLNKLLAVTALVAALPLASHAGGYYLSANGSGNLTPEHENTIKYYTKTAVQSALTTTAANKVKPEVTFTADKVKAKRAFGGGGAVAVGYSVPDSAASFEVSVGYDMYGTAKHKDKDVDFYGEDAMRALARAALPLNMGGSLAPYLGVGVGIQQIRTDTDKMDAKLKSIQLSTDNACTDGSTASNTCPAYGNLISDSKMKDISILGQGFAGASFEMQPEMAVFVEYSIDLAFQKPKMEDQDQEKTYFERSGVKHRIAAGMKYEF